MATIPGLYIALLGRPADPRGLAFFSAAISHGADLAAIGPFDSTAEYQSRFAGQSVTQIIQAIHRSLFNRDAQLTDLTRLSDAVSAGTLTVNKLAIAIIDGARGDDLAILNNKLAAAKAFTEAVDTAAEIAGYTGTAAENIARAYLASVDTTIPAKTTVENAVLRATGTGEIVTLSEKPAALIGLTVAADVLQYGITVDAGQDLSSTPNGSAEALNYPDDLEDPGFLDFFPTALSAGSLADASWIA
jgi:hypothetical protein